MAWTKTFRITADFGVPDKDIKTWLTGLETEAIISVTACYIPPTATADPRLCVVVTKLDDK